MSTSPAPIINLEFLPDWARQPSGHPPVSDSFEPPRKEGGRGTGRRDHRDQGRTPQRSSSREGGDRRRQREPYARTAPRPPAPPPIDIHVSFLPEARAFASVADQIKSSARTYPLFSLAKMFLEKPERYRAQLVSKSTPIFQCSLCDGLALNEAELVQHVLRKHRDNFYKEERVAVEPPKGNFTSVARCDLNGAILGPTNHHAYQASLMQLYKAQFSHLSFERFKNSIRTVHDPEAVKKWQEQSSSKNTYLCLQSAEPATLQSLSDLERHFREKHLETAAKSKKDMVVDGTVIMQSDAAGLKSAVRQSWEEENRFPLNLANRLRAQFSHLGLHIFKARKGMQFVGVARPKALVADVNNVSKNIFAILEFVKNHPGKNRKALLESLAPAGVNSTPTDADSSSPLLQDLHWLIRQGHVIEYHDGILETAKAPVPQKPAKAKTTAPATPAATP